MQSDIYLRTLKLPPPTETLNDKREISVPRSKNKPNNYQPATHTTNHFMIQDQVALQQSPKHFIIEESKVVSSLTNSTATDDSKYKIRSQPKSLIQRDRNSQSSTHFIIGESKVTSTLSTPKKYKIGPPKVQSPRHFIIDESRAKQKPARRIAMKNSIAPSSCNKLDPISFPTSSNRKRELSYEEYEKEMKKNKKSNKIQTKLNKTTDAKTVGSTESHKANKRSKPDDDFANALIPEIIYDPPEVNKDVPIKQEPHDKSNSNKVRKLEPNQQNNVVEKSAPKVKDEPESDDGIEINLRFGHTFSNSCFIFRYYRIQSLRLRFSAVNASKNYHLIISGLE